MNINVDLEKLVELTREFDRLAKEAQATSKTVPDSVALSHIGISIGLTQASTMLTNLITANIKCLLTS